MLGKEVSTTILKVFGMTRPGIEPRSPGPLANTLPTSPMSRLEIYIPLPKFVLVPDKVKPNNYFYQSSQLGLAR